MNTGILILQKATKETKRGETSVIGPRRFGCGLDGAGERGRSHRSVNGLLMGNKEMGSRPQNEILPKGSASGITQMSAGGGSGAIQSRHSPARTAKVICESAPGRLVLWERRCLTTLRLIAGLAFLRSAPSHLPECHRIHKPRCGGGVRRADGLWRMYRLTRPHHQLRWGQWEGGA
jgi:hypothetical protein